MKLKMRKKEKIVRIEGSTWIYTTEAIYELKINRKGDITKEYFCSNDAEKKGRILFDNPPYSRADKELDLR